MADESENPKFDLCFFEDLIDGENGLSVSAISGWAKAAAGGELGRFKTDYLDLPSTNAIIRDFLSASPAEWLTKSERVVESCLQGLGQDEANEALRILATATVRVADTLGVPGDLNSKEKAYMFETGFRLILSALKNLQDEPEGFFMSIMGGKSLEKWESAPESSMIGGFGQASLYGPAGGISYSHSQQYLDPSSTSAVEERLARLESLPLAIASLHTQNAQLAAQVAQLQADQEQNVQAMNRGLRLALSDMRNAVVAGVRDVVIPNATNRVRDVVIRELRERLGIRLRVRWNGGVRVRVERARGQG